MEKLSETTSTESISDRADPGSMSDSAELEVTILNSQGLHARPASQFVRVASSYPGVEFTVSKDSVSVNGKSIIGIMMLAAGPGSTLHLRAQGEGSEQLLRDIQGLIESRFGEND